MATQYQTYTWRFLVLASFCIVNAGNAIMWIGFAPINSLTQTYFNINSEKVNALSICFLALYFPGTILSMWIFNQYSLRTGLLTGAVMTAIAGWIRFASTYGDTSSTAAYGGVLFGQCVAGLAQPFFTNIPAKVSSRWFPLKERDLATTVGAMFNPIGIAIGTIVASSFVTRAPTLEVTGMSDWMLCQACVSTVGALIAFFLFRDHPPSPPSASQESTVHVALNEKSPKRFREVLSDSGAQVMACLKQRDFVWLLCAFGIGLGIFNALTTVVEQITVPICATTDDASLFGGLLIGIGLIGAGVFGFILDRTHKYRLALRIGFGGGMTFIIIFTLVLRYGAIDAIAAMFALAGFFVLPMLPTSFSAAAEVTYPVPEDVSSGILMTSGQITGIGFIFGLDALIPKTGCVPNGDFTYPGSSILITVSIVCCFAFILLFQGSNKRLEVDTLNGPLTGGRYDSEARQ